MEKDWSKKLRYGWSFLTGGLLHTNLQILYACNFRCQICDFWKDGFRAGERLSVAQATVVSDKLAKLGPQIVSIGGGEPLMHPELDGIVRALAKHHFPVMICNGWFVDEARAKALWEAGLYEVSVSVDYDQAALHDAQRGMPGAFDQALAALAALHRTRVDPLQRVHMIAVVMDDNLDHLEPLIKRCEAMGITFLVTLYSHSRGKKPLRAGRSEVGERLLAIKARHPRFVALNGYLRRFSRAIEDGGMGPCHTGKSLCNIDVRGEVSLCIERLADSVGNILTDDIFDLRKRLVAAHAGNACKSCWTSCRGSIESLKGAGFFTNMADYRRMTREVPLAKAPATAATAPR